MEQGGSNYCDLKAKDGLIALQSLPGRGGRALSGGQRCPSRAPRERVVPGLRTGAPIRGHLFSQQETIYSLPLSLHCCLETRSSCVRMREWRMARG